MIRLKVTLVGLGITAALALTGCSEADDDALADAPTASVDAGVQSESLSMTDPWVKASDGDMTAAFGVLANSSDADIRVVGATSEHARLELHEMKADADGNMAMSETENGFVITAGGERTLEPGGEHIMFMDVTAPFEAGTDIEIVLELEDGSSLTVTVPVRTFAGANEGYHGGDAATDGMDTPSATDSATDATGDAGA
jgi:periplasmic copper chaperone A